MADNILRENIIKDLGLDTLPENEKEESLLKIGRIIFMSVLMRVMEELSEQDKNEFEKILTDKPNDEEAIMNFLASKLPNFDEIVNDEVAKFKQESVGFMRELK